MIGLAQPAGQLVVDLSPPYEQAVGVLDQPGQRCPVSRRHDQPQRGALPGSLGLQQERDTGIERLAVQRPAVRTAVRHELEQRQVVRRRHLPANLDHPREQVPVAVRQDGCHDLDAEGVRRDRHEVQATPHDRTISRRSGSLCGRTRSGSVHSSRELPRTTNRHGWELCLDGVHRATAAHQARRSACSAP